MNNEIGRKITSLTLMTIMVAGGMTFAVPGIMPAAHAANANLFVSAENSQYNNYFGGPMVIEVVINDPSLKETDQLVGEPDVTVNGKILRMVQATDGLWYAYFADRAQAALADATATTDGFGLDFGELCDRNAVFGGDADNNGVSDTALFTDTVGYYLADADACSDSTDGVVENQVVREAKTPVVIGTVAGQIGINDAQWPIIQTYDLNPTGNVIVQYNKGGNPQTVTLTFDTLDGYLDASVDRAFYPQGAAFHATLTDQALNIDPTDEDSWTFNTSDGANQIRYQAFDESGNNVGACVAALQGATANDLTVQSDSIDANGALGDLRIIAGGSTYTAGDRVTVDGGVTDATIRISSAAIGAATGVELINGGQYALRSPATAGASLAGDNTLVLENLVLTSGAVTSATIVAATPGAGYAVGETFNIVDAFGTATTLAVGTVLTVDADGPDNIAANADDNAVATFSITTAGVGYEVFAAAVTTTEAAVVDANGDCTNGAFGDGNYSATPDVTGSLGDFFFEDGGILVINPDTQLSGTATVAFQDNTDQQFQAFDYDGNGVADGTFAGPVTLTELGPNSGVFSNYDETDTSNIVITNNALRGTSGTVFWDDTGYTILIGNDFGTIDIQPVDDEWNSGEEIPVVLVDQDLNLNTRFDEDLDLNSSTVTLVPSLKIGSPVSLSAGATVEGGAMTIDGFSAIGRVNAAIAADANTTIVVDTGVPVSELFAITDETNIGVFEYFNYDIRSIIGDDTLVSVNIGSVGGDSILAGDTAVASTSPQGTIAIDLDEGEAQFTSTEATNISVTFTLNGANDAITAGSPIVADFFSFGEGATDLDRVNNAIYRLELEETGDNTAEFVGSIEFVMLNQLNIKDQSTYDDISAIADDIFVIVHEDLTDEDSLRVNYLDLGQDGVSTQIADQEEAPTHSGVVSFDLDSYKVADTVVITLEDLDLNVDSDLIEIYTTTAGTDEVTTAVAVAAGQPALLNVTFDDSLWQDNAVTGNNGGTCTDDALNAAGFTLVETSTDSGVFTGSFQIPVTYCDVSDASMSVTGTDIEVNYLDYRDASGEVIEVGDSAGVRANTGTVSLDRTVYPVPFGDVGNFAAETSKNTPNGRSLFALHSTAITDGVLNTSGTETLGTGDLTIHVRVNDPDFDESASGEDDIDVNVEGTNHGPVKVSVSRGSDTVILAFAGGAEADTGTIDTNGIDLDNVREIGPINEIAPDAGIFEFDFDIKYTDGPASTTCPTTTSFTATDGTAGIADINRFDATAGTGSYCILQGDIITVEYNDPTDASGDPNTVTDSATFDLRNGVLQSDKSVYIIGGDLILTLIEPDLDLENDAAETYDLDLIEWDSDAATISMGDQGGAANAAAFDPEPSAFRETGDSTGIFQIVIEIPASLNSDNLERGEEIVLEYTDWGPSGSDFVGQEDEDINLTIFTSNFGATVELDQKVYTWTDKVYITVVAPDHNFDSDLIDEVGNSTSDPIKISTRGNDLEDYKLVETGTDTGIFTGEVILTGFAHDADGDASTGAGGIDTNPRSEGTGPTGGFLATDDDDGITVSFEFSEDETVVGSALIRWNIGEVQWLEASYPASGTGVVRIIDPDMNLDPESVDNFDVDVWSDSDAGGIDLTVTETNEATGIFEGTVFFTVSDESSGHRLRVAEGDTVTAEYEDNTLPDPYTTADELDITATSLIGTIVPPLERAPAANLRTVDAFGNSLDSVSVDQQVQISADLANGQDREQSFAYLVQVQDGDGVTVSLAWITGSLSEGQSFSPALSWIPTEAGTYTATAFVWESVDNPTALSPPVSTTVTVN